MTGGGGGRGDFFGSVILVKSDFFGYMKYGGIFLGYEKKAGFIFGVAKNGLRDFLGYTKKVVIFLGSQILKL